MECGVELQGGGDLHARVAATDPIVGFGAVEEETETLAISAAEREMWLNGATDQVDDLLGVNVDDDASMFYVEFPPLPDFPCMSSSSSSSSSTPVALPPKPAATSSPSSSSAASWAVLQADGGEEDNIANRSNNNNCSSLCMQNDRPPDAATAATGPAGCLSSTASMEIYQQQQQQQHGFDVGVGDCMDDVMEMDTFGYMELLEANDFFDPLSVFQGEEDHLAGFTREEEKAAPQHQEHSMAAAAEEDQRELAPQRGAEELGNPQIQGGGGGAGGDGDDEMSNVFLEWLKSNKDSVSASDLRSVKLKKSTIESAARRLGGGKEAMKQLLKLILEWVQTSHLQSKRRRENNNDAPNNSNLLSQFQDLSQNANAGSFGPAEQNNACFNQAPWMSPPNYGTDQAPLMAAPFSQPAVGYVGGGPCANGAAFQPAATEYHMLESANSWPPSQFAVGPHYGQPFGDNNGLHQPAVAAAGFGTYGNQYPCQFFHGPDDGFMRLGPSATKEARKKRMARQRRFGSHHSRHHSHHQSQGSDPHAGFGGDSCTGVVASPHVNSANWVYWQTMAAGGAAPAAGPAELPAGQHVVDRAAMQAQAYHQSRVSSDRRQGWKPEKNLRFLLQKVLKQSDVGSLGRIVLPKKEAETHLPELEARDGISITMEDIGTSRVWNMRYRYWPNNKSRMYLLENTGDFVRANGLQEGDFIVIYSDVKCGKFMIRGVKVRQQGAKPETKKAGKSQKNQHGNNAATTAGAAANNGTSSSTQHKNEKVVK